MKSLASFPRFSVEIKREQIPVHSMHPTTKVPDEKWRFVDKAGHGHFWDGKDLPTLVWVVTGKQWVGDEYDGEEYDVGEWRCKLCDEVVEPKKKAVYAPQFVDGPTTFLVTVENETFYLTPEQYANSLKGWAREMRKEMR